MPRTGAPTGDARHHVLRTIVEHTDKNTKTNTLPRQYHLTNTKKRRHTYTDTHKILRTTTRASVNEFTNAMQETGAVRYGYSHAARHTAPRGVPNKEHTQALKYV